MKSFLLPLAVLALLGPVRADIPPPKPTSITVSNLTAFPKYKFLYRAAETKGSKPIPDGQSFTAIDNVELLVQSGGDPAQVWEQIKYDWRGAKIAIKVEGVKQDGKAITVTYKTTGGDTDKKRAAVELMTLPFIVLAGAGALGLVVLARRRTKKLLVS